MWYLLDTNIISDLVRNPHGVAAGRLAQMGHPSVLTSIVVAAELRYGVVKRGSARLRKQVEAVLGAIEVSPFEASGRCYLRRSSSPARERRQADRRQRSPDCRPCAGARLRHGDRQRGGVFASAVALRRELAALRARPIERVAVSIAPCSHDRPRPHRSHPRPARREPPSRCHRHRRCGRAEPREHRRCRPARLPALRRQGAAGAAAGRERRRRPLRLRQCRAGARLRLP